MLFDKLKRVKAFILDVDGVLTNGEVLVTEQGEQLRSFNIRDGYALQLAVKKGFSIAVITGGRSEGVRLRLEGLGIIDTFMGIQDKITCFNKWLNEQQFQAGDVLYMGDDIPDLTIMREVGIAACPNDAVEEIKAVSHYISSKDGGKGAVRDVIEKVLKLQNKWDDDVAVKSI
ncbi:KdsC family phosphatase [Olivibacter domesticus]|uniref:3-deoxy-D-manno-octulosonate 8-phosphate phosphatase (KDO 8-P phosphatase) n=1 Tax=Olivibacter domesticus TaxID=407022 RepID=A0A1H7PGX0_OLID1|nr:HAD-IIIA family hydrolase [Olivibacter domesticus]SEL35031.1 3-deoxy-D-manno-octulosonate 8-phosphate phosphatase (KDO 8-P phosphatase) [Olivibacter domesticus]